MTVRVVTGPLVEPITLAEAKLHIRSDTDDVSQDTLITAMIKTAREYAENYTRRAFVQRTLELLLDEWPSDSVIELPYPPLVSVSFIKYTDFARVLQTVDPTEYQVDVDRAPGRVMPTYGNYWQGLGSVFNPIVARYIAGYPSFGSPEDFAYNVPEVLKTWMKVRVTTMFDNRPAVLADSNIVVSPMPRDYVDGLLDGLVVSHF